MMEAFILWIKNLNWMFIFDLLRTAATIALAIFAWQGLRTWKSKTHTQKQLQFIDDLTNAVNEYVMAMNAPVQLVHHVEIGINTYSESGNLRSNAGENDGFVKYIKRDGESTGKMFFEQLEKARPFKSKIQSLITKGQILGFNSFSRGSQACKMLMWSHDLISGLASLIANPNWYWENDEVQKNLAAYRNIKSSDIQQNLEKHSVEVLEFAKDTYQKLLRR